VKTYYIKEKLLIFFSVSDQNEIQLYLA